LALFLAVLGVFAACDQPADNDTNSLVIDQIELSGLLAAPVAGAAPQTAATSVTVSFNTNEGSAIASQTLPAGGGYVTEPVPPTRTGYTFDRWFADAAFTLYFNFNNPVSGNTTVYAKWNPILVTNISGVPATATAGAPLP
jgi:uncharacterized repeat protein (TIGR02543 family)